MGTGSGMVTGILTQSQCSAEVCLSCSLRQLYIIAQTSIYYSSDNHKQNRTINETSLLMRSDLFDGCGILI